YKVTYGYLVSPIILLLVKDPIAKEYDLSNLRVIVNGAAPLSKSLIDDMLSIHNITVKKYVIGVDYEKESTNGTYCSVEKLLPNIEAKIITENEQGISNSEEANNAAFDGNLYITDCIKEGFQVTPAELEEIITHSAVSDAAVVGFYCEPEATEYPLDCFTLQAGYEQSLELIHKIKNCVADRVALHKR
ncbi:10435_t:CDS:2, partial [Acaulospora morrowiae]